MKIFEPYNSLQQKIWSFKSYQKPLIESLLCILINRIKKSDSPVKLREKMLNFVVKYCENCMFCRAQVIVRGKTSPISWHHSTFLKTSRQRQWSSARSWRQNNGKMSERDRSHVIAVLQSLKLAALCVMFLATKYLYSEHYPEWVCIHHGTGRFLAYIDYFWLCSMYHHNKCRKSFLKLAIYWFVTIYIIIYNKPS